MSEEDSGESAYATSGTIADFADSIGLDEAERKYLDSLGLLNATADAFLAPGIVALKNMLSDGIKEEKVEQMLALAIEAVKSSR